MTEPQPDLTTFLAGVREHGEDFAAFHADGDCPGPHVSCIGHDVQRVVAAVEAVLALVDPPTTVAVTDLDGNWETVRRVVDCGKVTEAISRALLGDTP